MKSYFPRCVASAAGPILEASRTRLHHSFSLAPSDPAFAVPSHRGHATRLPQFRLLHLRTISPPLAPSPARPPTARSLPHFTPPMVTTTRDALPQPCLSLPPSYHHSPSPSILSFYSFASNSPMTTPSTTGAAAGTTTSLIGTTTIPRVRRLDLRAHLR